MPPSGSPPLPDNTARRLAALLNSSDDAIIGIDIRGDILTWNRAATLIYGYTPADALGRSIASLALDDAAADRLGELPRLLEPGERRQFETVRHTRDGRRLDLSVTISPLEEPEGTIVGASVIVRDITAYKTVERALSTSEARWRSIVESAVDGVIVIDRHGRIEAFNPAAERLFGYKEHEVVGRNVSVLMPPPHREQHHHYVERYLETGERKVIGLGREVVALRKDGSTLPVRLSVGEMTIDGRPMFTGMIHDLTERVEMEKRLREQSALTKLGEMAAVVAHEVKNPLAGVRGAIQVIGARLPTDSPDRQVMKDVIARLDALNELMKDMLLFARPPRPKLASVDVVPLLTMVADLVRQDPALKDLAITVDGTAAPVWGDAELLKIVTQNLLLNSAHAMDGRGRVAIAVSVVEDACCVTVVDNGPGIPPEVREKLFTPFFTTKARGTGLGLSTAKRLIEAHGGTIHLECPARGGTVVTLRLPLVVGSDGSLAGYGPDS